MTWLALPVWGALAGYLLGAWWSTRLTRAERRYLATLFPPAANTTPPTTAEIGRLHG